MNLSETLANIESLKKIAEQLEVDIKVIDDYVIFEDNGKKYCKICLGEYKSDAEKDILFLNSTNNSPNTINLADLEKLIELKNNTNRQQFLVLLNMIFAVGNDTISEKIAAVLCLNEAKKTRSTKEKPTVKVVKSERKSSEPTVTLEYIEPICEQLKLGKLWFAGKSVYVTDDESTAVLVMYSKSYSHSKKGPDFWFSFHPHQRERLNKYKYAYIAYCLIEEEAVIIMTYEALLEKLDFLHKTIKDNGRFYWHVRFDKINGKYLLRIPNKGREDVGGYSLHGADDKAKATKVETDDTFTIIKIKSNQYKTIKKKH